MRKRLTRFAGIVAALVVLAIGSSSFALASSSSHAKGAATSAHTSSADPSANEQQSESESTSAADADASGQVAACQSVGINPNADNVQYDDQSGGCALDSGASSGQ